jgi:cysteine desulfurase
LEKSINSRYYFDYNATSPLSTKVIDFLRGGEFLFGNSSSLHATGKKSKKFINESRDYLYSTFGLKESEFDLIFHSGATEGINTFFKGNAINDFKNNVKSCFFFSTVDHQAVISLVDDIKNFSHQIKFFEVDKNGEFDLEKLIKEIKSAQEIFGKIYLNFTYVNNENGVVWPLSIAEKIKNETKAIIHVDAVQLIGKIENWNQLNSNLDAYVFSAHKFGAMKGVGFSFIRKNSPYYPLITGGSQQDGNRSGTLNSLGIYSIKLALEDLISSFNFETLVNSKLKIEDKINEKLGEKGEIIAVNAKNRNANTIFLIIFGAKAELISAKFDLNCIDISTGSACTSGIIKENRIMLSMGYSIDDSKSCIRISFSPFLSNNDVDIYTQVILKALTPFL